MARDLRVFIVRYLRSYGAENADYNSAELVLGELLGNAARHARGPIEIHVSWSSEFPVLSMLDQGPAYDPGLAVPLDVYSEGGRGLFLVGLLTRSFTVTRLFGGVNETRAELDVPRRHVPAPA
jgi:anti-sigma regulatory factor (Ser/Thr protein kinase)